MNNKLNSVIAYGIRTIGGDQMDFDELINRRNTGCVKWDGIKEVYGREDVLPLWIADMDFKSEQRVIDAIIDRANHGVFGYPMASGKTFKPFIDWNKRRNNLIIDPDWIITCPGVAAGFCQAVLAFTKVGEKVMIQTPVYPPFHAAVKNNNRVMIENELVEDDGYYTIDFDDFEKKIKDNDVKLFILCNPHNPVGRVWTKEELEKMAEICLKYDVKIFSDEIHSDLMLYGNKFTSLLSMDEKYKKVLIAAMAPSKTFNIAGLVASIMIIPEEGIRNELKQISGALATEGLNIFGYTALEAAYKYGEQWLEEVLMYMELNADYMDDFIKQNMPEIKYKKPEGTYLGWLDFRNIFSSQDKLDNFLINKAKVGLNSGITFGKNGEGFARINLGCQKSILIKALNRIKNEL